ncbi:DUF6716 putative glycosyltransferase [Brevibacterium yomogidense]|uniref:DUF6716 putative glycosyltransferase n=1 Tax=Brevibacterium yomogidense TaxID=946573 RepID=UPI0018DF6C4F|nr:DUF6716 putative glycosyltransferase [Brevibacterium yomogidense]
MTAATASRPPSVLAIADSESYLKWAAQLLDSLDGFTTRLALVRTPILPTPSQIEGALAGSGRQPRDVPVLDRRGIADTIRASGCDVVLAAATGPVVQQVYGSAARMDPRPALVSGLPGVGLPATRKGQRYRRLGDAFLTHSHREAREYRRVMAALRIPAEVVVTRLPMLRSEGPPVCTTAPGQVRSLVFAPQAKVPPEAADRIRIVRTLSAWAEAADDREVVIKLRSREGEQETHHDAHPYRDLVAQLREEGTLSSRVRLAYGPMSDYLVAGAGLVTVSSTAALESLDRGLPTAIISDFGVGPGMLNEAFAGSGTERTLAQIAADDMPFPTATWLEQNYFHPRSTDCADALRLLAVRARERQLPDLSRESRRQDLRRIRAELRTAAPAPVVRGYRLLSGRCGRSRR